MVDQTEQTEFKDGETIRQLELQLELSKKANDKQLMREKVLNNTIADQTEKISNLKAQLQQQAGRQQQLQKEAAQYQLDIEGFEARLSGQEDTIRSMREQFRQMQESAVEKQIASAARIRDLQE